MARRSRPRRIRGPALQWRSGRESRSHHPRAEKRSAANNRRSAACGCAPSCARKVGCAREDSCAAESSCAGKGICARKDNESHEAGARKVSRARKVNEGRAGKNECRRSTARQKVRRSTRVRNSNNSVAPACLPVAQASRRLFAVEFAVAVEFVNRPTGRFILRSRSAGSKGSGRPAKRDGQPLVSVLFGNRATELWRGANIKEHLI